MTRARRIRLTSWFLFVVVLALLAMPLVAAIAQDVAPVVPADPTYDLIARLLQGGGLPAVLALVAWWARGLLAAGLSITVQLSAEDRRLLVAAIEARESLHRFEERITDHDHAIQRLERELDDRR